jgi:hypothetical protein
MTVKQPVLRVEPGHHGGRRARGRVEAEPRARVEAFQPASCTGTQDIISTPDEELKAAAADKHQSLVDRNTTIEKTLQGLGVQWLRNVHSYDVATMRDTTAHRRSPGCPARPII